MKLTAKHLKALILEELSGLNEQEPAPPAEDDATAPTEPVITYSGMRRFAEALIAGKAIPANVVETAKKEMERAPVAALAQFILVLLGVFNIDQAELTKILPVLKRGLPPSA